VLSLKVVKRTDDEIVISVSSVDEEGEQRRRRRRRRTWRNLSHLNPTTTLPTELFIALPDIASTTTATKIVRLVLEQATIILRPIEYGQTLFTLSSEISLGEVSKVVGSVPPTMSITSKPGLTSNSTTGLAVPGLRAGVTAEKLLYKLVGLIYGIFEKEHVIDARQMEVRRR
jgi:hypothetical protein